jgi:hypothetical protein
MKLSTSVASVQTPGTDRLDRCCFRMCPPRPPPPLLLPVDPPLDAMTGAAGGSPRSPVPFGLRTWDLDSCLALPWSALPAAEALAQDPRQRRGAGRGRGGGRARRRRLGRELDHAGGRRRRGQRRGGRLEGVVAAERAAHGRALDDDEGGQGHAARRAAPQGGLRRDGQARHERGAIWRTTARRDATRRNPPLDTTHDTRHTTHGSARHDDTAAAGNKPYEERNGGGIVTRSATVSFATRRTSSTSRTRPSADHCSSCQPTNTTEPPLPPREPRAAPKGGEARRRRCGRRARVGHVITSAHRVLGSSFIVHAPIF